MRRPNVIVTLIVLLLSILAVTGNAAAQETAAFVRNGFGVRGPALGNAQVADAGASPFYNPALAPFAKGQNLAMSVSSLSFDRSVQTIQLATSQQGLAGFAAGLLHSSVGNIDGRDNAGFRTALLSTDEFAGFLAFGLRLGRAVTAGISMQGFRSDLYPGLSPVSTIGVDLGVTVAVHRNVRVGLVLDDLLARYAWDTSSLYGGSGKTTTDNFPRRIRMGVSTQFLGNRLRVHGEWENRFASVERSTRSVSLLGGDPVVFVNKETLTLRDSFVRLGAEYEPVDALRLRVGLDRTRGGSRPGAGLSVAQQLANLSIEVEYVYVHEPFGLGASHTAGLRLFLDRN